MERFREHLIGIERSINEFPSSIKMSELLVAIENLRNRKLKCSDEPKDLMELIEVRRQACCVAEFPTAKDSPDLTEYKPLPQCKLVFSGSVKKKVTAVPKIVESSPGKIRGVTEKAKTQAPRLDHLLHQDITAPSMTLTSKSKRDRSKVGFALTSCPKLRKPCLRKDPCQISQWTQSSLLEDSEQLKYFKDIKDLQWKLYKGIFTKKKIGMLLKEEPKSILKPSRVENKQLIETYIPLICKGNKYISA
eukprot:gi/632979016/ref/XP_007906234.1/ PREDICTED: uncharacterized protein LOC103188169 [Callorhinchus milii]